MSVLSELTADEAMEKIVRILLEYGWEGNKYYPSWKNYVVENYDEELDQDDFCLLDHSSVWEALIEYAKLRATDGELTAKWEASQADGLAHDSEVYFVVFSLSDGETTRYFKRDGWYASYDGGHLEEGENLEVFPAVKSVTVFERN